MPDDAISWYKGHSEAPSAGKSGNVLTESGKIVG